MEVHWSSPFVHKVRTDHTSSPFLCDDQLETARERGGDSMACIYTFRELEKRRKDIDRGCILLWTRLARDVIVKWVMIWYDENRVSIIIQSLRYLFLFLFLSLTVLHRLCSTEVGVDWPASSPVIALLIDCEVSKPNLTVSHCYFNLTWPICISPYFVLTDIWILKTDR